MNNTCTISAKKHKETIPNGYKKTSLGIIPVEWEARDLISLVDILDNKRKPLSSEERKDLNGDVPYYGANGLVAYINDYIFDEKLILIAEDGGYFDEYQTRSIAYRIEGKSWVNNHAHVLKPKKNTCFDFIFYCLEHKNILKYLNGGTRAKLNKGELEKIKIQYANISEQQKISEILSTWDEAIANCKNTIKTLKDRNSGLAQQLLFLPKSSYIQLSKLVQRIKKPLIPEPNKLYRQIGIRSHTKGIFYKEEIDGLSLGNKSVFYIEPNCFILNIVFAWEHAIAKTTKDEEGMIASHRFPMYKPLEDKLDLDFLLYFFKSKKGKNLLNLASPGGAGRNKTLGQSEFLKLLIPVPDLKMQKYIAEVLDTANQELKSYETKLEVLQLQKKGLMQQLLTGKIRVNVK